MAIAFCGAPADGEPAQAIRMLRKLGPDEPKKYNHFKHMTADFLTDGDFALLRRKPAAGSLLNVNAARGPGRSAAVPRLPSSF